LKIQVCVSTPWGVCQVRKLAMFIKLKCVNQFSTVQLHKTVQQVQFSFFKIKVELFTLCYHRDVSAGMNGATAVAPKFLDTLTLSQRSNLNFPRDYVPEYLI
jgi:hypothetical protein